MRRNLAPPLIPSTPGNHYLVTGQAPVAAGTKALAAAEYWRVAWNHKLLIATAAAVCGLAAYGFSLRQKPVYSATARVEVLTVVDTGAIARLDAGPTAAHYPDENYVQTQVELLRSKALFARVLANIRPGTAPSPAEVSSRWRRLDVKAAKLSRIIDITYESPDPHLAAATANGVAAEFIEQSREQRWASASQTAAWLRAKLGDLRADLSQAQDQMQKYATTANLIYSGDRTSLSTERLRQLQAELATAQGEMISRGARLEITSTASPDAVPEVLDDSALRDYQGKLTELRRQEAELGALLTPEHYKVVRIKAQIAELQALYERQRSNILGRLKLDYQAAQRKTQLLSTALAEQAKLIHGEELSGIQYDLLRRNADAKRQLYDSLLQKIGEASLASVIRPNDIRTIDPAEEPSTPARPRRGLTALAGTSAGLLLGFGLAVVLDARDRSIKTPREGADYLRVPELGSIPLIEQDPLCAKDQKPSLILPPGEALDFRREGALPTLMRWHAQPSIFAESFRGAALSLLFAGNGSSPHPQIIVVTSALPREGKSVFSVNLSIALAKLGRRTLLIDGDARRPKLHHLFDLGGKPGLMELLGRNEDLEELALSQLGHASPVAKLTVIPNDGCDPSAPDALASERMAALLRRCRRDFDTIIIDSPPVLLIPDARALGRLGDGVVLVVRARDTSRDAALKAVERFAQDGTPILGTVLNRWNLPPSEVSSYYNYCESK